MTSAKLQSRPVWGWWLSLIVSLLGSMTWYGYVGATPVSTGCGGQNLPVTNAAYEQRVVELVNAQRTAAGLSPLKWSAELSNAARFHAVDMFEEDYFEHDTYDLVNGDLMLTCRWYERVRAYLPTGATAENIGWGYVSPEAVVEGWLASDGHRQNILGDDYWEIGVGYHDPVWVQDFARYRDRFPLIINAEAAETTSRDVNLYLYGDWAEMRLRNDNGEWGAWQPFQRQPTWQLATTPGLRRVEAELRNAALTYLTSDEIELQLDEPLPTPDLPEPTATPSPACEDTCLEVKVTWEGRPSPPHDRWIADLSLQLFPDPAAAGQSPLISVEDQTDVNGALLLSALEPGNYQLLIRGANTLQRRLEFPLAPGRNVVEVGRLRAGDIQVNNHVDIFDFSLLSYLYERCRGAAGFNPQADLNQDGCIDAADLQLLQANFGAYGDDVLTLSAAALSNDPALMITNKAQGERFALTLRVPAALTEPINAAAIYVDFDPTLLRATQIIAHERFTTLLLQEINNQLGQVDFASGVLGEGVAAPFELLQVGFEVLQPFEQTELSLVRSGNRNTELATGGDSLFARAPGGLQTLFVLQESEPPTLIPLYLPLVGN